jgi:serine/threonine protein kinase/tetratricopeptide (TPR) repeat protein
VKKISHYSTIEKLGSGGMGEVFLARDETLDRKVAIKVLPEQFVLDDARLQRFQKEARVVSALNHPNILTIFEVGEDAGQHFIVTEYIEGETLRQRLERGSVTQLEVVDIGIGVISALAEAHHAGIIHRDIKPENVMIRRDGLIKVLDFGLARRNTGGGAGADSSTAIRETAPGTVMGTISYMSPEQARGLSVDGRSDLFSVGAVLYEALTGHIPFEGSTSTDILAAILHRPPPPIERYSAEVPRELQWIVEKALHKDVEERYQTAKEMLADLRRVRRELEAAPQSPLPPPSPPERPATISSAEYIVSGIRNHKKSVAGSLVFVALVIGAAFFMTRSSARTIDSVAVLPFSNATGDASAEYLADGVTENLINSLSEISGLRVVPRSSVFRYKNSDLPIEEIAEKLRVRAVVSGRVQKQGSTVAVQAELVDAASHAQLWGKRFEAPSGEMISIQRQLAQQTASKLRPRLSDQEQQRVQKSYSTDPEALDLYMRGRFLWSKRTTTDIRAALETFEKAIDRDPDFALAWAGIADVHIVLPTYDPAVAARDSYPKAREAARRALQLDPEMAEAHAALAGVLFEHEWNMAGAESEFRRAIELKPGYAPARYWFSDFLGATGRMEEALVQADAAREADPLSMNAVSQRAFALVFMNRPEEALREADKAAQLDPNAGRLMWIRGWAYLQQVKLAESAQHWEALSKATGDPRGEAMALVLRGKRAEAAALAERFAKMASESQFNPYYVAVMYSVLGEEDQAMHWLDRSYQARSVDLAYIAIDPMVDPLREDPRFHALLRRIGVPSGRTTKPEWVRQLPGGA